jgi:aminoglycoside phosphotransferase (APT) family kinase protein
VDLPDRIGPYEVQGTAGGGGVGLVVRAHHQELGRDVALKFPQIRGSSSELLAKRLRREAKLAARLRHPNIVMVHEVGEHDGRPFLVMEWVEGRRRLTAEQGGAEPKQGTRTLRQRPPALARSLARRARPQEPSPARRSPATRARER